MKITQAFSGYVYICAVNISSFGFSWIHFGENNCFRGLKGDVRIKILIEDKQPQYVNTIYL